MKQLLLRTNSFIRAAKRTVKKHPFIVKDIQETLELLSEDAFHPLLKTHKLKGDLEGSWACSVSFELRIIFSFVQHEGMDAILLETVGTHEEVY
ncbi:MAG: type II toxin-antitoxin system mRNA interferase toxin, RelE/StbE family [Candidatus Hatepunaea meridiana]|nr:type II toxin-antitoxin system mRNA interferase toxin, RelE/StbE family [Candidatus Hatepunaea meridiana]